MPRPIPVNDLTWLHMDRPHNLMVVNGLMWFDEEPDWDAVQATLQERLVGRFPVFGQRAVEVDGRWVWQDDPEFALANHVTRTALTAPGDEIAAQDYVAARFSEPMDRGQPLWSVELITGFTGFGQENGALLLTRFHHALADGVRLVQVLLSVCDQVDEGTTPGVVGRGRERRSSAQHAGRLLSDMAEGGIDIATGVGRAALRLPSWARPESRSGASPLARHLRPTKVIDAFSTLAEEDNLAVNTGRSVSRLALSGRSVETVWSGRPGEPKKVSWVTDLDVDVVRGIGRAHGVTINDVCLGLISRGLTDYLEHKGETSVDELNWLVPISLKPIDAELPPDLGNHFSVVMTPMPIGIDKSGELFGEMSSRMNRIKHSGEPAIVYGIQQVIGLTPPAVSTRLTSFVANKSVGVLTNVPGPRTPLMLGGQEVIGMLGFVPTSSDQAIGVAIFSYNGRISIGVISDAGLIPDPERITAAMAAHYRALADEHDALPASA